VHISGARALRQFPRLFLRKVLPPIPSSSNALKAITLATLATLWFVEPGLARPAQTAAAGPTTVTLGAVSAPPREQVMVPLFLTPGGAPVGSLTATIRFEKNSLSFLRAEKGFLLDSVGVTFRAEVTDDAARPGQSVIQLEVSTAGANRRPLRDGLVLSLVFRVEPHASPDSTVRLLWDRLSATTPETPPRPVASLVGREGTVEVLRTDGVPYVGCFFFTH